MTMIWMTDIGIKVGQVWRVDPHRDGATDVEVTGSGTRGGHAMVMTKPCLPGGWSRDEVRPVELKDFVRHAVLVCDTENRSEYDKADRLEPFVR